jgi:hypothetical protein
VKETGPMEGALCRKFTGTVYFECLPFPFVTSEVTRNSVAAY